MKLHRLILTNYRGITHRDIEFPDHGIIVVSGANETGKTSMLEALDLLLDAKDRSNKKEVKQVKPTHADVGAEVTAEISTGPYRFVYRKRFHKRTETELTLLAPQRVQLTGDDAHDRVRVMLAETVDMDLWHAQRVLQSAPTAAADLSGCNALSRALDVVAGEVDDVTDVGAGRDLDGLLIDRIDGEYRRYFTSTGRPAGELAAATKRLKATGEEVTSCAAAIAEVDDAVRSHSALTAEMAVLADETTRAAKRLTRARVAAQLIATLSGELDQARVLADAAESTHAASLAALTERRRARADIDERTATITGLQAAVDEAAAQLSDAGDVQAAANKAAGAARSALEAGQVRVDAARAALQRLTDREQAERLTGRINAIEGHQHDLDVAAGNLAAITLTGELMQTIEETAGIVDSAIAAAERASAHLELVAASDLELAIDGRTVALRAGGTWSAALGGPTGVEVPGVLSIQVTPGAPAAATAAALDTAQAALSGALQRAGVSDVAAARVLDEQRRTLLIDSDRLRGILDAVTVDGDVDALRARLSELSPGPPSEDGGREAEPAGQQDPVALRTEFDVATSGYQQAVEDCETGRKLAEKAAKLLAEREVQAVRAKEKLEAAQAELARVGERLAAQRATVGDDQLTVKAEAEAEVSGKARARVDLLCAELARHQPEVVATEHEEAEREAIGVQQRHDQTAAGLREIEIQLKLYGTQGRKGRLDSAETEHQHATGEFERVQGRARAADLLRTVVRQHRHAMRLRYVDPFRSEVERLGRLVFGESFEVDVDSELRIGSRTLSGCTVPYESLSGGAKEQLGIVARLAGAAMVAKEDSVPVVIDDALGFTDAGRLSKMAQVFDAIASDGQVIILTCSPQRYAGVSCAESIELSANPSRLTG